MANTYYTGGTSGGGGGSYGFLDAIEDATDSSDSSGSGDDSTTIDDGPETELSDTETASGDNFIDATADWVHDQQGVQRDESIADGSTVTADEETPTQYEYDYDPVQTATGTTTEPADATAGSGYEEVTGPPASEGGTPTSSSPTTSSDLAGAWGNWQVLALLALAVAYVALGD